MNRWSFRRLSRAQRYILAASALIGLLGAIQDGLLEGLVMLSLSWVFLTVMHATGLLRWPVRRTGRNDANDDAGTDG